MSTKQRNLLVIVLVGAVVVGLITLIIFARQRLFTRTEPIVLST
jgi:hypothetical protein